MSIDSIESDFQKKVSAKIRLESEGTERFRVFTPFRFDDGDHLVIVLKKNKSGWLLSDEAHTYMRLTYDIKLKDLHKGTRQKIISNVLTAYQVQELNGELILNVPGDRYGDALFTFVQALIKISDVSYLTRVRIRSTFKEDFRALLSEFVPNDRLTFNWHDSDRDPQRYYMVDCRVNSMPKPLFVHAIASDGAARDATISLLQFERWEIKFRSLAIFQDQETISRRVLARYSDVCEKQFSSLVPNKERIVSYVSEAISL